MEGDDRQIDIKVDVQAGTTLDGITAEEDEVLAGTMTQNPKTFTVETGVIDATTSAIAVVNADILILPKLSHPPRNLTIFAKLVALAVVAVAAESVDIRAAPVACLAIWRPGPEQTVFIRIDPVTSGAAVAAMEGVMTLVMMIAAI